MWLISPYQPSKVTRSPTWKGRSTRMISPAMIDDTRSLRAKPTDTAMVPPRASRTSGVTSQDRERGAETADEEHAEADKGTRLVDHQTFVGESPPEAVEELPGETRHDHGDEDDQQGVGQISGLKKGEQIAVGIHHDLRMLMPAAGCGGATAAPRPGARWWRPDTSHRRG